MNLGSVIFPLISIVFGAGGAYFLIQQSRKDVNGLGAKVNRDAKQSAIRHQNTTLALMLLADTDDKKQQIAEMLRESQD